jgi:hypothetical protein
LFISLNPANAIPTNFKLKSVQKKQNKDSNNLVSNFNPKKI